MIVKTVNDKELVKEIREKIKNNGGYCPCVIEALRTEDDKCICKDFREKIENKEKCTCHCGLYEIVLDEG